MPKFTSGGADEVINVNGAGTFQFSAVRIENLGATEYTLVTIVIDISGSVIAFANELLKCLKSIIEACKKSPKAENVLVRIITFSSSINEIHGFKELVTIDANDYKAFSPRGNTALYDATYNGIKSITEFSSRMVKKDFATNGALYIITDGMDNESNIQPSQIKDEIENALKSEQIESIISVLIGINISDSYASDCLDKFHKNAALTQFIDAGKADAKTLAKLGQLISQSISSQSQSLGTGGPSQPLVF